MIRYLHGLTKINVYTSKKLKTLNIHRKLYNDKPIEKQTFSNLKRIVSPKIINKLAKQRRAKIIPNTTEANDDEYIDFMSYDDDSPKVSKREFREELYRNISEIMDLSTPHLWFPVARSMKRKFYLHVGPTNSGKTHTALERLKSAKTGVYCGPLRLLAEEIFEKLNLENVKCNLMTGQKVIYIDEFEVTSDGEYQNIPESQLTDVDSLVGEEQKQSKVGHVSCTIEMADLRTIVDCALIDEYQMIADRDRGWAWTNAILGLPAKEIHLCGDLSSIELVKRLLVATGDDMEIVTYKRLSPLKIEDRPLPRKNLIKNLGDGDALIVFSKKTLYKYRKEIETAGKKCCVVYGNLPPENRSQQSKIFNNETTDRNILVATDAIGMGLNLNIRRIIFSETVKFDGTQRRDLTSSEIKQIGGRAGRFKSRFPEGRIAATSHESLSLIRRAFSATDQNHKTGLLPLSEHIETFERLIPDIKLAAVLNIFSEAAVVSNNYFLCNMDDVMELANRIDHLNLPLKDKYALASAPCYLQEPIVIDYFEQFCTSLAMGEDVRMPTISDIVRRRRENIKTLEAVYMIVDLYLWLSYRFPAFVDRQRANEMKIFCEKRIEEALGYIEPVKKSGLENDPNYKFSKIYKASKRQSYKKMFSKRKYY